MLMQLTLGGFAQGAIYALIALSLTVVYRSTTVVNFGHGDFVMAGAFLSYVLVVLAGIAFLPAAVLAMIAMFVLGVFFSKGLIRPIRGGPHIGLALMCISAGYILRGIARMVWGREVLPMPPVFDIEPIFLGNLVVTGDAVFIIGTVFVLLVVFFGLLGLTDLGKMVQAVYQSPRGARLIGLNVERFNDFSWGVGAALGALGGILVAPISLLHPDLGASFLIKGFAAMTLGGFGSLGGAVLGGILLGLAEQYAGAYVDSALIEITAYVVIVLVLFIRPHGLFGRKAVVKV
ncbi:MULTISPECIES: branched-chain amino acid ABC transporter permease [Roseobacteraceae]|uniref:branched-chain amino acid ABC transporter permease n=1 Tax=Roseobacteraceae TaxID=2854170 RepID=UPI00125ED589|nr:MULTISPECIES: branched-chain amino acid ABC transporter permease [Roseobacteraceae]KAB6714556.1 branched-chain amino acid ABC transporter permease [Roseobacter sp. TSBP12]|tara:strand:+ start:462 stop:1331 length:870 start_codon:yes stop_codon:yes gene_type:complete